MINLMYIVLTAMLALNVSSDVLDSYHKVHDEVNRNSRMVSSQNQNILNSLKTIASYNPQKALRAYSDALFISGTANSLVDFIDSLKQQIALQADGAKGNPDSLISLEDMDAASIVMLNPLDEKGKELRNRLVNFRALLVDGIKNNDSLKSDILQLLETGDNHIFTTRTWENEKFDNQPAIATITLLSQIANNVQIAEGEALRNILNSIDANDTRVNQLQALVIPNARNVMKGTDYKAKIMIAAVDTTNRPEIIIDGEPLSSGIESYSVRAVNPGINTYSGQLMLHNPDGSVRELLFTDTFNVLEPMAVVAPGLMNVLYAGIDNPIKISVPGISPENINVTVQNAGIRRSGQEWLIRPDLHIKSIPIKVFANLDGISTLISEQVFKVRALPDPSPFLEYSNENDQLLHYKGGRPISRNILLNIPKLSASIDDGILELPYQVESFEIVYFDSMGNAMIEISDGASFSKRQKEVLRRIARGKRVYISKIKVTAPDGTLREISPMEILVN